MKTPPTIQALRATDSELFATLETGEEIQLVTFRETLWNQAKVMLPPPFDDDLPPLAILSDWKDEESDLKSVDGCIHDPWTAGKTAEWAADKLPNGTHRRK